jgi:Mrp family chromosome partitioning ATPase
VDVAASELFGSQRMADFVSELKARYRDRVIIFDTPALLASNDALVLAKYVDEVVVVVGADSTPRHVTESALELFDTHDNVSLVLNKCPLATDTHVGDEIGALGRAGEAASS